MKQPAGKRFLFYAGGILANILGAFVLLYVVSLSHLRITEAHPKPSPLLVQDVVKGMPAEKAGLHPGDHIHGLGELRFPGATTQETVAYIQGHAGKSVTLEVDRDGRPIKLTVTPEGAQGAGRIGVHFGPAEYTTTRRDFQALDPLRAIPMAARETGRSAWNILHSLWQLVSGQASVKQIGGPIAIIKAGSKAAKTGWESFFLMSAFISMNLAIFNALPIPFLDGGHMLILIIEKLLRRELSTRLKERILTMGFFLLIGLMVVVIGLDLWRLKH